MRLIRGEHKTSQLALINREALDNCDEVWAAVAYVTDNKTLIKPCYEKKIPFHLWARYDYSIPVKTEILSWFIGKSPACICKLIPDIFHSKVIWWKAYGIYIGSANLTDSAWFRNFEAGIFLSEDEINEHNLKKDIEIFFDEIDESSFQITEELVHQLKEFETRPEFRHEFELKKLFDKQRRLPTILTISPAIERTKKEDVKKKLFLAEWEQALQYIRDVAERISQDSVRPKWIPSNIPKGVQADQFLHAYYYNLVMEGNRARHREFHEENKGNPNQALENIIDWWSNLTSAPSKEDRTMFDWAPFIAEKLHKDNLNRISLDDFAEVFSKVHAFRNYADRANYQSLGLMTKPPNMSSEERGIFLAKRLFEQQNENDETIISVLNFLLYGGSIEELPTRLYEVWSNKDKSLRHVGLGTYGEVVGWALPDKYPPRNGRTSKALYALGYDVRIYSE